MNALAGDVVGGLTGEDGAIHVGVDVEAQSGLGDDATVRAWRRAVGGGGQDDTVAQPDEPRRRIAAGRLARHVGRAVRSQLARAHLDRYV